jgi:hypothetical protein
MTKGHHMSTINETITNALPSGTTRSYPEYVRLVDEALTEREYVIRESLTEFALGKGLQDYEVDGVLDEVGLAKRPLLTPEPVSEGEDQQAPDGVEARLFRLETLIGRLVDRLG